LCKGVPWKIVLNTFLQLCRFLRVMEPAMRTYRSNDLQVTVLFQCNFFFTVSSTWLTFPGPTSRKNVLYTTYIVFVWNLALPACTYSYLPSPLPVGTSRLERHRELEADPGQPPLPHVWIMTTVGFPLTVLHNYLGHVSPCSAIRCSGRVGSGRGIFSGWVSSSRTRTDRGRTGQIDPCKKTWKVIWKSQWLVEGICDLDSMRWTSHGM
jgi:hypothetical protein